MGRFLKYVFCPNCRKDGRDRAGDNLATYLDGSAHCFACGYHRHPTSYVPRIREEKLETSALPVDFTREVPAEGWKWLLQYGLPYSYWRPYCGYSPAEGRLIITHGSPPRYSVGRLIGGGTNHSLTGAPRKWKMYGDRSRFAAVLGDTNSDSSEVVVVVEDIVSGHKVAQVAPCLPLFGTSIYPKAIMALKALKRPIRLWLDGDVYPLIAPKINRLQAFLDVPVGFIRTRKDPKEHTLDEIRTILSEAG